jgi:hypothetical protein
MLHVNSQPLEIPILMGKKEKQKFTRCAIIIFSSQKYPY